MFQNRNKISKFTLFIMLALVISSSFCLNFLTMSALAAGTSDSITDSQSANKYQPMSSDDNQCQLMNQSDNKMHQPDGGQNNTPIISPLTTSGIKDCCLNKDNNSATLFASSSFDQNLIVTPLFIAGENIGDSFSDNYLVIPSPPPYLAALSSIKKNE